MTVVSDGTVTATNTGADHAAQTVTITATAKDDAGNLSAITASYPLTVVESEWTYEYSGGQIQEWTCPVNGYWQLEAMGAKGADSDGFVGGNGADIAGMVYIQEGQKLYIYLGQSGSLQEGSGNTGPFNGGGYYTEAATTGPKARFTAGGGATDFALKKTTTWNDEEHLYSRILVAGGGGGALYWFNTNTDASAGAGGSGGGEAYITRSEYEGEEGIGGTKPGKGGTLSAGGSVATTGKNGNNGSFGKGGNYSGTASGGCGGGGWFGGASGSEDDRLGAGGGGSSFIYNAANLATAKAGGFTYDLRMPTSSDNFFTADNLEITPTILTAGGSASTNGQARIIYKSAE